MGLLALLKAVTLGWRDDSVVKGTGCAFRDLGSIHSTHKVAHHSLNSSSRSSNIFTLIHVQAKTPVHIK